MGIVAIGIVQAAGAINGNDATITFSTAPIAGDVVYFWGGHVTRAGTNIGPSTAGYTQLVLDTSTTCSFGVWRKVMGATPDTTVVGQGTGNTADATGYCCIVLRGVNATPEDATTTTASGTSTNPNPPSITTVTDGTWVIVAAGSLANDGAPGTVSGYTNDGVTANNDTNNYTCAGATRLIAAHAAEDPGAWSSWSTGAWFAASIAVRQADNPAYVPGLNLSPMLAQ